MTTNDLREETLHSIGDLADATGISVDTIRIWERRYGRPTPVRLPSGHRRYTDDQIRWMRQISEALARGQRPSKVVPLTAQALDALLAVQADQPDDRQAEIVARLFDRVRAFDGPALASDLEAQLTEVGARRFLSERVAPLLVAVGRAWTEGSIEIRHEHLLSEILEDRLRALRVSVPEAEEGRTVLLATLSGETHGMGLQMAAVVAALAACRPRILGTDTPNEEIVAAAVESGARAVLVSVSLATGGVQTDRVLAALRSALPERTRLVIGGRGARGVRRGPRGIDYVTELDQLEKWLRKHCA